MHVKIFYRFYTEGHSFLNKKAIVGDETWIHYHKQEIKRVSKK